VSSGAESQPPNSDQLILVKKSAFQSRRSGPGKHKGGASQIRFWKDLNMARKLAVA
jgi:hypothetical protein